MKIINKNYEVAFNGIEQGQCFQVGGDIFMRTELIVIESHGIEYNTVNLATGKLTSFDLSDRVLPRPDLVVMAEDE